MAYVTVLDNELNDYSEYSGFVENFRVKEAKFIDRRIYLLGFTNENTHLYVIELGFHRYPQVLGEKAGMIEERRYIRILPYEENHLMVFYAQKTKNYIHQGLIISLIDMTDV